MNGLWKENLGGWNHKGQKRKKQKRKHTIRDRARALLKVQERKDIGIWEEGEVEFKKPEKIFKNNFYIEIWRVKFLKSDYSKYIYRDAYFWNNCWYNEYTDEPIHYSFVKKVDFLYATELVFDKPIEIKENPFRGYSFYVSTTTFIFGKPLPNWKKWTLYNDGRRRKFAQKQAHSKDRAKLREWISKGDWDSEIKTHALSKSILWEVH